MFAGFEEIRVNLPGIWYAIVRMCRHCNDISKCGDAILAIIKSFILHANCYITVTSHDYHGVPIPHQYDCFFNNQMNNKA